MDFNRVTLTIDNSVATITLNHPEVLNGISAAMLEGFSDALDHIEQRTKDVRAILLTGAGRAFCSGANLQGGGAQAEKRPDGANLETLYHPIVRRLRLLDVPLVGAVNGVAAGAGMSLALSCDLILAAKSAYFLQAFRRIGLVPDVGSTWLLPRLIGRARALELSLLGEKLPAETALQWGLINRVYEDAELMPAALALTTELAHGPTRALGMIRQLYWASEENSYEQQLNAERQAQKKSMQANDFFEGVAAFQQKRPARFTGA